MSTHPTTLARRLPAAPVAGGAWRTFDTELTTLLHALSHPGQVIAEVEQMRTLLRRADRVEPIDPGAAAALRRQAARVGLDG
jgi:hypothetical protein